MARGQGAGKKGDPMVPVYSPHLRAAIADKRLRVTEVARRLKEHQQTVAYLAGGEGIKRCRRSRRARLAKLLGVSEQWLAEPTVMIMPLYPPAGSENVFFGTGFPPESPRAQLATTRLLTKCAQACEHCGVHLGVNVNLEWLDTTSLDSSNVAAALKRCDGIIVRGTLLTSTTSPCSIRPGDSP